jgi:hypothetical protein
LFSLRTSARTRIAGYPAGVVAGSTRIPFQDSPIPLLGHVR